MSITNLPSPVPAVNSEDPARYEATTMHPKDQDVINHALRILMSRLVMPETYITEPDNAATYLKLKLAERKNEVFGVLWLDNRHGVLCFEELFNGTVDGATIPPRVVVQRALEVNAVACIFAHNHPSGNPEPSTADNRITERLIEALKLIDVRVLDHIIVGGAETCSFAERGLI